LGLDRAVHLPHIGWLSAGYSVALVEKKLFPREKTCGDGLTPRAVYQLENMG
jgi:hypothetical protein